MINDNSFSKYLNMNILNRILFVWHQCDKDTTKSVEDIFGRQEIVFGG